MTLETPIAAAKPRDAAKTRRLLLQSARRRFAYDGYASTTVRDIAADAGVNVALINRYFTSKEGLFAACLERAVEDLDSPKSSSIEQMIAELVAKVGSVQSGEHPPEMLLLIRSSGDERVDAIRRATLDSYSERMAAVAGWRRDDPSTQHLLLRAQIALATTFGIVLLRASTAVEPLSSATEADLTAPLEDVFRGLLQPPIR